MPQEEKYLETTKKLFPTAFGCSQHQLAGPLISELGQKVQTRLVKKHSYVSTGWTGPSALAY